MNWSEKQNFIRQKAIENLSDLEGSKISWSRHAIAALVDDNLTRSAVEKALAQCEIIEDYSTGHRTLPDCLVLAELSNRQPIHAVVAIDEVKDRIFMVTVYLPSTERWQDDWRTRK